MSNLAVAVNVRDGQFDVWGARGHGGIHLLSSTVIGEKGWLGNPYGVPEYGRERCIELYAMAFKSKLRNEKFYNAVVELRGKRIACFCKPLDCHVDVIVNFLNGLDN